MSRSVRLREHLAGEVERLAKQERRSLASMVEILLEQALAIESAERGFVRHGEASSEPREGIEFSLGEEAVLENGPVRVSAAVSERDQAGGEDSADLSARPRSETVERPAEFPGGRVKGGPDFVRKRERK